LQIDFSFYCLAVPEENLLTPDKPDMVSRYMYTWKPCTMLLFLLFNLHFCWCPGKIWSSLHLFSVLWNGFSWRFHPN